MFTLRALLHPARGGTAMAVAAVFLLGVVVGATIVPDFSSRKAAAQVPAAPPSASREPHEPPIVRLGHPVEVVRVLDGDTFEARVNVWPGIDITTKVRLRGIDAPELRARCAEEQAKAQAARSALIATLAEGAVAITRVTFDKYGGRVVADATTRKTADVSAAMLRDGHVRSYVGGRRENWC